MKFLSYRNRFIVAGAFGLTAILTFHILPADAFVTTTGVLGAPSYTTMQPPAKGGTYTDPVFGTVIKRLSDSVHTSYAAGSGNITTIGNEYSTMPAFNEDNSRLLLCHRSYFALYDGAGNYVRDLLPYGIHASSQPRWSRTDRDVLYFLNGNQIKKFNAATSSVSVVRTFSEYTSITGMGESDLSFDGTYMVLNSNSRQVFMYNLVTNTKGNVLDLNGKSYDSLYITPDNNVIIGFIPTGSSRYNGYELYDRNMNFLRQETHAVGHMDVARDVTGEEVMLFANGADPNLQVPCVAGVTKIRLSDGKQTCVWRGDWSLAIHVSAADNSGWFFIETYAPSDPMPGAAGWVRYTNEILQIKMDGSEVRRLAHHRSRPLNGYTYQPKASASHDGTKLVYSSNFGLQKILGYPTDYSDAYMINLGPTTNIPSPPPSTPPATPPPSTPPATPPPSTPPATPPPSTPPATPPPSTPPATTPPSTPPTTPPPGPISSPRHLEQNNSAVQFSGRWYQNNSSDNSGGSTKLSRDSGARASFRFVGNAVSWTGLRDRYCGIARVYIDGVLKTEVDTYSAAPQVKATLYNDPNLSSGSHTFTVEVTGRRNSSSGGNWIYVDAFDYTGEAIVPMSLTSTTPLIAGGFNAVSSSEQSMRVGSAELNGESGKAVPSALAIFGYHANGVLISEAAVPSSPPMLRGRIYAQIEGAVNTGLAIENPNDVQATITFAFADASGNEYRQGTLTLPPHGQISKFLDQAPFNGVNPTNGTFTFSSNVAVSAIALRGFVNERFEFLLTTLPVADPDQWLPATLLFPQVADGAGWSTTFVLVNPSDVTITGTINLLEQGTSGSGAGALTLNVDGASRSSISYSIPPRSSRRYATSGSGGSLQIGSAQMTPSTGNTAPAAVAVFSFKSGGVTISEAGVAATGSGAAYRMYAESGQETGIRTGLAITNLSDAQQSVNMELFGLNGVSTGLKGSLVIPALGQRAAFLNEISGLSSVPASFKGIIRIASENQTDISVVGLRGRVNERGEFLMTTTDPTDEQSPANTKTVLPHIVDGGGYTTQFILYSGSVSEPANGDVRMYTQTGTTLSLSLTK